MQETFRSPFHDLLRSIQTNSARLKCFFSNPMSCSSSSARLANFVSSIKYPPVLLLISFFLFQSSITFTKYAFILNSNQLDVDRLFYSCFIMLIVLAADGMTCGFLNFICTVRCVISLSSLQILSQFRSELRLKTRMLAEVALKPLTCLIH